MAPRRTEWLRYSSLATPTRPARPVCQPSRRAGLPTAPATVAMPSTAASSAWSSSRTTFLQPRHNMSLRHALGWAPPPWRCRWLRPTRSGASQTARGPARQGGKCSHVRCGPAPATPPAFEEARRQAPDYNMLQDGEAHPQRGGAPHGSLDHRPRSAVGARQAVEFAHPLLPNRGLLPRASRTRLRGPELRADECNANCPKGTTTSRPPGHAASDL